MARYQKKNIQVTPTGMPQPQMLDLGGIAQVAGGVAGDIHRRDVIKAQRLGVEAGARENKQKVFADLSAVNRDGENKVFNQARYEELRDGNLFKAKNLATEDYQAALLALNSDDGRVRDAAIAELDKKTERYASLIGDDVGANAYNEWRVALTTKARGINEQRAYEVEKKIALIEKTKGLLEGASAAQTNFQAAITTGIPDALRLLNENDSDLWKDALKIKQGYESENQAYLWGMDTPTHEDGIKALEALKASGLNITGAAEAKFMEGVLTNVLREPLINLKKSIRGADKNTTARLQANFEKDFRAKNKKLLEAAGVDLTDIVTSEINAEVSLRNKEHAERQRLIDEQNKQMKAIAENIADSFGEDFRKGDWEVSDADTKIAKNIMEGELAEKNANKRLLNDEQLGNIAIAAEPKLLSIAEKAAVALSGNKEVTNEQAYQYISAEYDDVLPGGKLGVAIKNQLVKHAQSKIGRDGKAALQLASVMPNNVTPRSFKDIQKEFFVVDGDTKQADYLLAARNVLSGFSATLSAYESKKKPLGARDMEQIRRFVTTLENSGVQGVDDVVDDAWDLMLRADPDKQAHRELAAVRDRNERAVDYGGYRDSPNNLPNLPDEIRSRLPKEDHAIIQYRMQMKLAKRKDLGVGDSDARNKLWEETVNEMYYTEDGTFHRRPVLEAREGNTTDDGEASHRNLRWLEVKDDNGNVINGELRAVPEHGSWEMGEVVSSTANIQARLEAGDYVVATIESENGYSRGILIDTRNDNQPVDSNEFLVTVENEDEETVVEESKQPRFIYVSSSNDSQDHAAYRAYAGFVLGQSTIFR